MKNVRRLILIAIVVLAADAIVSAQSFTYQGKLTAGGIAANGQYDLQFRLYDGDTGGTQQGLVASLNNVQITNGIFTVELDFGPGAITPGQRWIEMEVRPGASTGAYNLLAPRQKITEAPYSTLSGRGMSTDFADAANDANTVGGISPAQLIQEGDSRLTDARQPLPGDASYVQTSPSSPQSGGFDVLGNGKVGSSLTVLGATFLNSSLSVGGSITGDGSGVTNINPSSLSSPVPISKGGTGITASGSAGSVLRSDGSVWSSSPILASDIPAGSANYIRNGGVAQTGSFNISGTGTVGGTLTAGFVNSTNYYSLNGTRFASINGNKSVFYGESAGQGNFGGADNTYIGYASQSLGIGGSENTFIGSTSGLNNSGSNNFFGGSISGWNTTSGDSNTFVGSQAGTGNIMGDLNTLIGRSANVASGDLINATAIGAQAVVSGNNSLVLGRPGTRVGIGASAPKTELHVVGATYITGQLILKSPDGGCHQIIPQNGASTTVFKVQVSFCPDALPAAPVSGDRPAEVSSQPNKSVAQPPDADVKPASAIIRSPSGACWEIAVSDSGVISAVPAKKCE